MSRLESFSAGERFAVDPDAIERELSMIWREAGTTTEGQRPVTRACLWNVIVHLEERQGQQSYVAHERLEQAVNRLAAHLASRTLVLRTRAAKSKEPELESWISANCILSGTGGKLVCSEEITLASRGTGARHLAGLVRALLVPGIPTALLIANAPRDDDALEDDLFELADRLVTDLDRLEEPSFDRFEQASTHLHNGAMDLSWLRLAGLRQEIAHRFDVVGTKVEDVVSIDLCAPDRHHASKRLLLGWLAAGFQATAIHEKGAGWSLERPGKPLLISLQTAEVWRVVLNFGAERPPCEVVYDKNTLTVAEGESMNRRPASADSDAALVARALTRRSMDDGMQEALRRGVVS